MLKSVSLSINRQTYMIFYKTWKFLKIIFPQYYSKGCLNNITRYWPTPSNKLYINVHIKLHVKKNNLKSIKLVFKTYLLKQHKWLETNIGDSKSSVRQL